MRASLFCHACTQSATRVQCILYSLALECLGCTVCLVLACGAPVRSRIVLRPVGPIHAPCLRRRCDRSRLTQPMGVTSKRALGVSLRPADSAITRTWHTRVSRSRLCPTYGEWNLWICVVVHHLPRAVSFHAFKQHMRNRITALCSAVSFAVCLPLLRNAPLSATKSHKPSSLLCGVPYCNAHTHKSCASNLTILAQCAAECNTIT
jgi:hypothetical protein